MASSTQNPPHHLSTPHGATAAPPPTPSAQPNLSSNNATLPDALSHLLHRLPPTLSLSLSTRRRSSSTTTTATPPVINLSDPTPPLHSASTQLGYFHLTPHHPISPHLPPAAESAALSLFNLPHHRKKLLFPNTWPLGYDSLDNEDDDDDVSTAGESFCLDSSCSAESAIESDIDLGSLRELGSEMEKLGLKVMEELGSVVGFESPGKDDPTRLCSLLWVSDGMNKPGRVYPYVIGLHYQMRCQKYSLLSDSGWANVSGQADSVLVTLGDIAQVWSNGKLKKVRGIPMPISMDANDNNNSSCITMSLLITLPLESTVSPLIPGLDINAIEEYHEDGIDSITKTGKRSLFRSFSFEDYAWRVYHERLLFKDPLVRYRV
ncbi:hypothetical protein BUALT_Bualt01G0050200 [Buddleja alternifolia]|uniref:Uncharacterized protein n=1 Tax=Buddleja alternifolia TaxID=168488 RepID=A0AAV6YAK0_9LAMI|nr:hypothetical protein BUALT_Bualt01G0050200 [Buddleja alternifolia]